MEGDSLKLNFEIALEKIDTLTKQNIHLMNKVEELESKLLNRPKVNIRPSTPHTRFEDITKGADEAMKKYQTFLRKEFPSAKSK